MSMSRAPHAEASASPAHGVGGAATGASAADEALLDAIMRDDTAGARRALEAGASVHHLAAACATGAPAVARLLANRGADVNRTGGGSAPFHHACERGDVGMAQWLASLDGVHLDAANDAGLRPLQVARERRLRAWLSPLVLCGVVTGGDERASEPRFARALAGALSRCAQSVAVGGAELNDAGVVDYQVGLRLPRRSELLGPAEARDVAAFDLADPTVRCARRRYTEFKQLVDELGDDATAVPALPALPPPRHFTAWRLQKRRSAKGAEFRARRRDELHAWLRAALARAPQLATHAALLRFCGCTLEEVVAAALSAASAETGIGKGPSERS